MFCTSYDISLCTPTPHMDARPRYREGVGVGYEGMGWHGCGDPPSFPPVLLPHLPHPIHPALSHSLHPAIPPSLPSPPCWLQLPRQPCSSGTMYKHPQRIEGSKKWIANHRRMLQWEARRATGILDELNVTVHDGRRGTEEDIQLAAENMRRQEFKLSQLNVIGTVIFDDRPTVHLDPIGMQWNAELHDQEQQLPLSSEKIQQAGSRTIELASASAGTGASPGAGEAAAPGARDAAGPGAGEAASDGSRSRGRSSSLSRFAQVDGQRTQRWHMKNAPIAPPIQLESSSRTSTQSPERAAEAVTMPLTATARHFLHRYKGASSKTEPMRILVRDVQVGAWDRAVDGWLTVPAQLESIEELESCGANVVASLQERSAEKGIADGNVAAATSSSGCGTSCTIPSPMASSTPQTASSLHASFGGATSGVYKGACIAYTNITARVWRFFVVAFDLRETSAMLVLDEGDAPRDARPYRVLKRHRLTNAETIFTSPDFRAGVRSL
jgi:hypothetical protein